MNKKDALIRMLVLGLILVLVACSAPPTPEPTPLPTNPPPTATPLPTATPTPTATPVPYRLTVKILGMEDQPVLGAEVLIAEKKEDLKISNENGEVMWDSLPGEAVSISVKAQGYKPADKKSTLQRGDNSLAISLEVDPWGLLPSKACAEGEKGVYFEDLQDQQANNWPEIDMGAQGWSVGEVPGESGNFAIIAQGSPDIMVGQTDYKSDQIFDNAVWRIKVMIVSKSQKISSFLNWRHSLENGDLRYFVHFGPGVLTDLTRFNSGQGINVGRGNAQVALNKWTNFEVSTFNGVTEVWMNGKKMVSYTDKNPLPPGTIGLEPHFNAEGIIYYDDLAVCELNGPFAAMPTAAPTPKK